MRPGRFNAMSGLGNYLYGVMRAGIEIPSDLSGIDADHSVGVITCGQLAALTSVVPLDDFESDEPADPAWIVPRALRHELLIEKMLSRGPILPVRFGALFSSRTALATWVSFNHEAIVRFLDHVAGKEEWTLKVDVLMEAAFETLIALDPAWALKARLLPASPGARYFHEKRLREEARRDVRERARVATEMVRMAACALAEERVLVPKKPDGHDVEPVAHLAYLVPCERVSTLWDQVAQATGNIACLRLIPSGPWPPSHFCPPLLQPSS
jgi:hypothetical protein